MRTQMESARLDNSSQEVRNRLLSFLAYIESTSVPLIPRSRLSRQIKDTLGVRDNRILSLFIVGNGTISKGIPPPTALLVLFLHVFRSSIEVFKVWRTEILSFTHEVSTIDENGISAVSRSALDPSPLEVCKKLVDGGSAPTHKDVLQTCLQWLFQLGIQYSCRFLIRSNAVNGTAASPGDDAITGSTSVLQRLNELPENYTQQDVFACSSDLSVAWKDSDGSLNLDECIKPCDKMTKFIKPKDLLQNTRDGQALALRNSDALRGRFTPDAILTLQRSCVQTYFKNSSIRNHVATADQIRGKRPLANSKIVRRVTASGKTVVRGVIALPPKDNNKDKHCRLVAAALMNYIIEKVTDPKVSVTYNVFFLDCSIYRISIYRKEK